MEATSHNNSLLLLMWIEICFRGKCQLHYSRRRIGDTNGPWEDSCISEYIS